MEILNYTPHAITICNQDGTEIIRTIPSVGVARVSSTQRGLPALDGIPVTETIFGEVVGLPAWEPNYDAGMMVQYQSDTIYIVSDFVLRAALAENPNRTDLVRPDTGPSCVRKDGMIWAVKGLTR